MSQSEARAWWADVEHVRESIERRRALGRAPGASAEAGAPVTAADDLAARRSRRDRIVHEDYPAEPRRRARAAQSDRRVAVAVATGAGDRRRGTARPATNTTAGLDRRAAMVALAGRDHAGLDADRVPAAPLPAFFDQDAARPRASRSIRGDDAPRPAARGTADAGSARARARSRRRRATPMTAAPRPRPDRVALWAVILGFVLIFVAATSSHAATHLGDRTLKRGMQGRDVRHLQLRLHRGGFLDAPATGRYGVLTERAVRRYQRTRCLTADGVAGPSTIRALRRGTPRCRRAGRGRGRSAPVRYVRTLLGTRTLGRGMRGSDVRTLQRLLGVEPSGTFGPKTARAVRRLQRRAGLAADGRAGPDTRRALASRTMRARTATWYGPGLYGRRTACGNQLTHRLMGVAHRSLPCGSPVTLSYGGRFITVRVVDRGPYTRGVSFDLTAATARALGMTTTSRIRARA